MTRIAVSNQRPVSSTTRLPAAFLVAGVLSCLSAQTPAEEYASSFRSGESVNARQAAADLERAFWVCDYAATTRGVSLGEGAECGAIFEDLKKSKFGDDFRAVLTWWQQNKAAEHKALAAVDRLVATRKADQITAR